MTHKILANPRHRYNRGDDWDNMSTMSALEAQLLNLFQRDFLSLLGIFQLVEKLSNLCFIIFHSILRPKS